MSSDGDVLIDVRGLGKQYQIYQHPQDRLKQFIFRNKTYYREFWALRDVDLQVRRGQTVGIIGRNGSGKSTLLQIICGTLQPTLGSLKVRGRISALLELGAGFNPEFTGRENVRLYGALQGLSPAEVTARLPRIMDFAEIGSFIDMPVKTYSSGMFVRLAFAAAINVEPDILVVDEALAVGDARFQHRCMARIKEMQESGVAILYVSHDTEGVKRLCDEVVVLQDGRVVNRGQPMHISNWYVALVTVGYDLKRLAALEADRARLDTPGNEADDAASLTALAQETATVDTELPEFRYFRHGDGGAQITRIFLSDEAGRRVTSAVLGQHVTINFDVRFERDQPEYLVGLYVTDRLGTHVIGINTYQEKVAVPPASAGDQVRYSFRIPVELRPGFYSVSVSVAPNQFDHTWLDNIDNGVVFRVVDPDPQRTVFGVYLPADRQFSAKLLDAGAAPVAGTD